MFLKKIKKSIALALICVTVAIPIMNTSYALEQSQNSVSTTQIQNNKGETITISISDDNTYKSEFNKDTGLVTHTYYNEDGSVNNSYSTNYYENMKEMEKSKEEFDNNISLRLSGPVIYKNKSWSPDNLQLQVKEVKRNGKTQHQCDLWNSSNTYKQEFRTKYTSSASVMAFNSAINNVENTFGSLASLVGSSAAIALASYFAPGAVVTVAAIAVATKQLGFDSLLKYTDTIAIRFNGYSHAIKNANNKYNAC